MSDVKFYEEYYDVVIIGGALAGCSAALVLAKSNLKVLVLEQHNLPGGVATSFVRGGEEFEASLHEMNAVGDDYENLFVSNFVKEHHLNINFIMQKDCFRYQDGDVNVVVHPGVVNEKNEIDYSIPARDIASVSDEDCYEKVKDLLEMSSEIVKICNGITEDGLKLSKFKSYMPMITTAGYSTQEVFDALKLPDKVQKVLGSYWNYLGTPLTDLPFTMYATLIDGYMGHSPAIPVNYSYELGLKLANAAEEAGAQIEYKQRVDKILVKNNKVYGVKTARGDIINCKYVISGTYPNNTYRTMIEPESEVPSDAIKFVNSKKIGVTCFSVIMLLDKSPEELGFENYATFYNPETLSVNKLWENGKTIGPYKYFTSICQNMGNPNTSRKGTTIFSSTIVPDPSAWEEVTMESYRDIIKMNADYIIKEESKRLGFDLREHILEIIYETPMTVARYSGAYQGCIYGYRHTMEDHIIARTMQEEKELFIQNLYFTGATTKTGDGMAPQFMNGDSVAKRIIKKERGGK